MVTSAATEAGLEADAPRYTRAQLVLYAGKRPGIAAFVDGVTAAAIGVIAGAVIVLGRRQILVDGWWPDRFKTMLFVATLALLVRFKKLSEPIVVLAAAAIGLVVYPSLR